MYGMKFSVLFSTLFLLSSFFCFAKEEENKGLIKEKNVEIKAPKEKVLEKIVVEQKFPEQVVLDKKVIEPEVISEKDAKLAAIKKGRSWLKRDTYKKEIDLKQDIQEWKSALKKIGKENLAAISRRLEELELKAKIAKLDEEKVYLKKYENLGERKATFTRLKNQEKKALEIGKKSRINKINKEREQLEKISVENYIPNRLVQIKSEFEKIKLRQKELEQNLNGHKVYAEAEIKRNLRLTKIALNLLREAFHESMAQFLQQEQEIEGVALPEAKPRVQ